MTIGISNNSAALAILRQSSAQDISGQQQNATDRIIDIVSGKTGASAATGTISKIAAKAQSLTDAEKSASGGSGIVSSEMSRSYSGAVSQAVQTSMNNMLVKGSEFERELWKANLENGKAVAGMLVDRVQSYNNKIQIKETPDREEWTAKVLSWEADRVSQGADPDYMKDQTKSLLSDEYFQGMVDAVVEHNENVQNHDPDTYFEGFNMLHGQFAFRFGVSPQLSFDEAGQAHLGAFEVKYGSGQTMMSYDGTGNLKAYNADGSEYKSSIESYGE